MCWYFYIHSIDVDCLCLETQAQFTLSFLLNADAAAADTNILVPFEFMWEFRLHMPHENVKTKTYFICSDSSAIFVYPKATKNEVECVNSFVPTQTLHTHYITYMHISHMHLMLNRCTLYSSENTTYSFSGAPASRLHAAWQPVWFRFVC